MAISCKRSLSSSTSRTFEVSRTLGFSPLIVFTLVSSKNRPILARASLRGVGQRTRRTARQRHAEMSARTLVDYSDLPAVRLDQLAGDRQAKAAAFDAAGVGLGPPAKEEIEDRLALFRGHARPAVHHLDHRFARQRTGADRNRAARRRELHRVRNQVVDDRAQLLR